MGLVHLHGVDEFDPPPLCDLGRAHRTCPDAATGLQPLVAGRAMGLGLPDLDV